jgi:hypothetical protein
MEKETQRREVEKERKERKKKGRGIAKEKERKKGVASGFTDEQRPLMAKE